MGEFRIDLGVGLVAARGHIEIMQGEGAHIRRRQGHADVPRIALVAEGRAGR